VDKNLVPLGKTTKDLHDVSAEKLKTDLFMKLVLGNFAQGCTFLFRRELLQFLPVPRGIIHDHFFILCASILGGISYSEKSVEKYRQHENNVCGIGLNRKKSFAEDFKYRKKIRSYRKNTVKVLFEIFPKVQEILPPEKSAEVYKKLSDAKKIVVHKNIFAFKKYYSVIFLDEKRFDKFLLRFFSRYVRGILLLF
jgi:hypothetical protein